MSGKYRTLFVCKCHGFCLNNRPILFYFRFLVLVMLSKILMLISSTQYSISHTSQYNDFVYVTGTFLFRED